MSGTFKDKPTKIKYKDKWPFNENEEQSPKKRKEKNTEWLCGSQPLVGGLRIA